jgi:hypothetical protein
MRRPQFRNTADSFGHTAEAGAYRYTQPHLQSRQSGQGHPVSPLITNPELPPPEFWARLPEWMQNFILQQRGVWKSFGFGPQPQPQPQPQQGSMQASPSSRDAPYPYGNSPSGYISLSHGQKSSWTDTEHDQFDRRLNHYGHIHVDAVTFHENVRLLRVFHDQPDCVRPAPAIANFMFDGREPDIKLGGIFGDLSPNIIAGLVYNFTGFHVVAVRMFRPNSGIAAIWLDLSGLEDSQSVLKAVINALDQKIYMDNMAAYYLSTEKERNFLIEYLARLRQQGPKNLFIPRHLMRVQPWISFQPSKSSRQNDHRRFFIERPLPASATAAAAAAGPAYGGPGSY